MRLPPFNERLPRGNADVPLVCGEQSLVTVSRPRLSLDTKGGRDSTVLTCWNLSELAGFDF